MWRLYSAFRARIATALGLKRAPPPEIHQTIHTPTLFPLTSYDVFQLHCYQYGDSHVYISVLLPTILTPRRIWNSRIERTSINPMILAALDIDTFLLTFADTNERHHFVIKFSSLTFSCIQLLEETFDNSDLYGSDQNSTLVWNLIIFGPKIYRAITSSDGKIHGPIQEDTYFTRMLPKISATLTYWNSELNQLHKKVDLRRKDTSSNYYEQAKYGFSFENYSPRDLASLPILCNIIGWLEHAVEYSSPIFYALNGNDIDNLVEEVIPDDWPDGH